VRIDFSWAQVENTGKGARNATQLALIDKCVGMIQQRGMQVFAVVAGTPGWANGNKGGGAPPTNPNDFKDFMQFVAERYNGKVSAWQLYNEPNNAGWTGTIADYAAVLKAGNAGVKAVSTATVVAGGITFNDFDWVRQLYANNVRGHFDALGVHPYPAKADEPPAYAPDGAKWWYPNLSAVRQAMVDNGDSGATIWITEMGYSAHTNELLPSLSSDYWWALGVTEAQQAQYGVDAMKYARANWPYVPVFIWYKELSWPLGTLSPNWFDLHVQNYGLLKSDQSPRPVYCAFKTYLTGSTC
jgi:hypothetical protein